MTRDDVPVGGPDAGGRWDAMGCMWWWWIVIIIVIIMIVWWFFAWNRPGTAPGPAAPAYQTPTGGGVGTTGGGGATGGGTVAPVPSAPTPALPPAGTQPSGELPPLAVDTYLATNFTHFVLTPCPVGTVQASDALPALIVCECSLAWSPSSQPYVTRSGERSFASYVA